MNPEEKKEHSGDADQLIPVERLAAMLCTTPQSIRTRIQYAPERFPPLVRIPGCRRLLWRLGTVTNWIRDHEKQAPPLEQAVRGLGRGVDSSAYQGSLAGPALPARRKRAPARLKD